MNYICKAIIEGILIYGLTVGCYILFLNHITKNK